MTGEPNNAINWLEALKECDYEEDFLREILSDLKMEVCGNMEKIEISLSSARNMTCTDFCNEISRASHSIKGSSGNLMCNELVSTSSSLEELAKSLLAKSLEHRSYPDDEFIELFNRDVNSLRQATQNFYEYLVYKDIT